MSGIEFFQLGLEVAEGIFQLAQFIANGVADAVNYGPGFEKIRLAISLEASTFSSIKAVLFGGQGGSLSAPSGVFVNFDQQTQLDIIYVLRQFREALEAHYRLVARVYNAKSPGLLQVTDALTPFGSFHSTSIVRKLRFGFSDKAKFEQVLQELEVWNERLFRAVQVKIIQIEVHNRPSSGSSGRPSAIMDKLQQSNIVDDVRSLGLASDLQLAQLSLAPPTNSTPTQLEIFNFSAFEEAAVVMRSNTRRLVQLSDRYALLEYKEFNADERGRPPPSSSARINQLSRILQKPKSDRYHTLQCDGYYCSNGYFVLIFTLPNSMSPSYTTLSDRLQQSAPALEGRFYLARQLCATLIQLHTVGWVHKSFRSDNCLFFPSNSSGSVAGSKDFCLSGWEYSRPELEFSSRLPEAEDIAQNIYRHPHQWGLPTVKFSKTHDVYSLGVVLLEIGRWKRAIAFLGSSFSGCVLGPDVKNCLVGAANNAKLRVSMGKRYQAVVLKCLQGSFEGNMIASSSDNIRSRLSVGEINVETLEREASVAL